MNPDFTGQITNKDKANSVTNALLQYLFSSLYKSRYDVL